ncbi:MAG: histidine kinase [Pseudomonadota bacterium]
MPAVETDAIAPSPRHGGGKTVLAVALLAVLLMGSAAAMGLLMLGSVTSGQRWVIHSIEVQLQAERLRTDLRGLGRAALDALASEPAAPVRLDPWRAQTQADLVQLQRLVADNPAQTGRALELAQAFEGHLAFLSQLRPHDAQELAERRARAEALEQQLADFSAEEGLLLRDRQRQLADSVRWQAVAIVVLGLLSLATLLATAVLWRQLVRQREHTEAAARRSAALEQARDRLESLARQLLEVEENERRALARELHDDLGQRLAALKMNVQIAQAAQPAPPPMLGEAVRIADECIAQVRQRAISLRPAPLDELGVGAALRAHVQEQTRLAGVQAQVDIDLGDWSPTEAWSSHVFRIVQEAVRNAIEHGRPRQLQLSLAVAGGACTLEIVDDGAGLGGHGGGRAGGGMGLLNMRERCELLGGRFEIGPAEPRGTRVCCRWPTDKEIREG